MQMWVRTKISLITLITLKQLLTQYVIELLVLRRSVNMLPLIVHLVLFRAMSFYRQHINDRIMYNDKRIIIVVKVVLLKIILVMWTCRITPKQHQCSLRPSVRNLRYFLYLYMDKIKEKILVKEVLELRHVDLSHLLHVIMYRWNVVTVRITVMDLLLLPTSSIAKITIIINININIIIIIKTTHVSDSYRHKNCVTIMGWSRTLCKKRHERTY